MNLEDRLRSHMHSGDDLFVETGRDAGAIAAAGRRRTRRNQVGGAAVGGLLALGLVFGIGTQLGDGEPAQTAGEAASQAEPSIAEMAEIEAGDSAASDSDFDSTGVAPAFVPFEVIVGVDGEFAGLRTTENGIVAIRSADGIDWTESSTTGIPDGAEITVLVEADGVFAAPFAVFDNTTGEMSSYIGTSIDLNTWTVVEVDLGDGFDAPFLGEIALVDGEVVAVTTASPPVDEEAEVFPDQVLFALRGPIGGPYVAEPVDLSGFGVSHLRAAGSTAVFTLSTDAGSDIVASTGADWTVVRRSSFNEFPTLATDGSAVFLVDASGVERTDDAGVNWAEVDTSFVSLSSMSNATAASGDDTVAVLFGLVDDDGLNAGYVLAAGSEAGFAEVSLGDLVPDRAFVSLVAVNDEEALLEVFPEPEVFDEELASSSELVEVEPGRDGLTEETEPRYVRVPIR